MSLLNQNTLTPAQLAAQQVIQLENNMFLQLGRSGVQGYNLIWRNRNATPAEVIAALGTNCRAVFELAYLNIQTVEAAAEMGGTNPPNIPAIPSNYVLTFNSDGSGNLRELSSSSEESSSSGN